MQAKVYCASPPVIFGINAFNSDKEPIVVRFKRQATTMAPINTIPTSPAPWPSETRQLVAITSPTEVDITLPSPNFFSSISSLLQCVCTFIAGTYFDHVIQGVYKDLTVSDVTGI